MMPTTDELVEVLKKAMPWLQICSDAAESGDLGEINIEPSPGGFTATPAADAQIACAYAKTILAQVQESSHDPR